MGIVVSAELRSKSGRVRRVAFEVRRNPEPESAAEVQEMLIEGRPVAGRILRLSDPVNVAELDLDGEPGETIQLIEGTEYWVLNPGEGTRVTEWAGGRIGTPELVH